MCEQTELRPLEEDATWRCSVVCEQTELRPLEEDATTSWFSIHNVYLSLY